MNVDVNGMYIFIERLPHEDDYQLADRRRWVVQRVLQYGDPSHALQLSRCYHYIVHKHCVYPAAIHQEIGIYVPRIEHNHHGSIPVDNTSMQGAT